MKNQTQAVDNISAFDSQGAALKQARKDKEPARRYVVTDDKGTYTYGYNVEQDRLELLPMGL